MSGDYAEDEQLYQGGELFRALGGVHEQIIASLEDLKQRTIRLEEHYDTTHNTLDNLEERLDGLLSDNTQRRADLQNESHILHLALASDYRSLIMQWMQRVARKVVGARNRPSLEYGLGRQVADFSEHLFRGIEPDVAGLLSSLDGVSCEIYELAASMCDRASALRQKISDIGVQHEWDFRTEISGEIDEERQEAWLTCDPTKPVCLVVAPAYVVQGTVYEKQMVATSATSIRK